MLGLRLASNAGLRRLPFRTVQQTSQSRLFSKPAEEITPRRWKLKAGLTLFGLALTDQGFRRCCVFWTLCGPMFVQMLWIDKVWYPKGDERLKEKREAAFARIHARNSPIIEWATLRMRGFYLKCAQLMSMRDDYVPEVYMQWIRKLQHEAPMAMTSAEAQAAVCAELGLQSVGELLDDWQDTPIGTASIGQVFKARMKSSGEWVAIKVQDPAARKIFYADIQCLKLFTYFALPWAYANMCEIEETFEGEFDYLQEARSLQEVRDRTLPKWSHKVYIPRPIPELTSSRVLGMELLRGEKFVDAVRRRLKPLAEREGKTVEDFEREQIEAFKSGQRTAVSARAMSRRMRLWRAWHWLTGKADEQPVDLGDVFETLMQIQGQGVLRDGCFNADPHPGNILLLEDGKTLGLIDFGQLVRISPQFRVKLAKLILALSSRSPSEVADAERGIGVMRKHYKEEVQYRICSFWLDRDTDEIMQGMNMFDLLAWGEWEDRVVSQPEGYHMACRCSLVLRSMALYFGVRLSTCDYWRPYAEEVLKLAGPSALQEL